MAACNLSSIPHGVLLSKPTSLNVHSSQRACRRCRVITAHLSLFPNTNDDEDHVLRHQELALNLNHDQNRSFPSKFSDQTRAWLPILPGPPGFERDEINVVNHKLTALSSVKRAFSSMVFIVRELQSMVVQMKEKLLCEDLHEILERVQHEVNSSFVWLFQQIFSCTPVLMLSVMILLANFTVYSMDCSSAMAVSDNRLQTMTVISSINDHRQLDEKNVGDCRRNSIEVALGLTEFNGGGGGGKGKPVAGATDDGWSDNKPSNSAVDEEMEMRVWDRMMEEAKRMRSSTRHEALMEPETIRHLVAPVAVDLEEEEKSESVRTELQYVEALSQDPDNVLLLSNFAQFLYLVLHDNDRAEHYFKRAVKVQPADAEALSRYANFLWLAKKDIEAAEEMYLEAIDADPGNTVYAANYAHFLWNTGGDDTCFLLDDAEA